MVRNWGVFAEEKAAVGIETASGQTKEGLHLGAK